MTLFDAVSPNDIFHNVLKFFTMGKQAQIRWIICNEEIWKNIKRLHGMGMS